MYTYNGTYMDTTQPPVLRRNCNRYIPSLVRMNLEVQISDTPYYDDCSPQGWKLAQTLDDEYNIGLHGIYGEDELVHYNHEATCLNCGSNADCNINCLGKQSCPSTGDDALAYILDATNIVCPDNADCNIVCQCTETDCSNTCAEIFIDRVLFDISCPTDSLADECVITIDGGGNAYGTELINAIIVADSNSFLGFTLDCSEAIPCWTVNDDPFAPTWSAPMVICNADTALNCTMEQVNDEWDVFRCRDEGDDCDVSLSPTTATTAPSLDPTQINDPTQNPFNSIYTSLSTRDSYSDSSSESEDSSSSDEMDANAAFANNDQYLSDIMGVQNRDKINVTINVSKSPLVNLWVLFILLFVTIWISIICVHHCKQC
eukprot:1058465_1